ncbi:hypothetical protein WOLCODRAFT_158770 [Wolfiporia cocos MD-104 SS10]|uniref:Uncharacterized protein n=1 Tax=Wolfiporia cocos (strain MD-104) TaxID=742152 RepID=A0A2H3JT24_WOLCO|nr:hypothetical protein WOLCODRAFT_158770 [Wolfiporia cocos MD-104 SS10]
MANSHHQLPDHCKDDPICFPMLTYPQVLLKGAPNASRLPPTPKLCGDYISMSLMPSVSYVQSTISSNFTLLMTSNSLVPSLLFDNQNSPMCWSEDSMLSTNAFSMQLKKLYLFITILETKVQSEDQDKDWKDIQWDAPCVGVLVKCHGNHRATTQ